MKDFDRIIQEDTAGYQGIFADLIHQAPALYRLLVRLLEDPNLPGRLRPLVLAAIAYFALPADIVPEDLQGASGYRDDVFLSAFILDRIRRELDSAEVLVNNWEGNEPIEGLLDRTLAQERELIGDKRELILWYIGFDYLL